MGFFSGTVIEEESQGLDLGCMGTGVLASGGTWKLPSRLIPGKLSFDTDVDVHRLL